MWARPLLPTARRASGSSASSVRKACPSAGDEPAVNARPPPDSTTSSPTAPRAGPTTGVPQASASAVASENVSVPLVSTTTSLDASTAATSTG